MENPTVHDYLKFLLLAVEHAFRLLGSLFKTFFIYIMAVSVAVGLYVLIFEYSEGWNDVSNIEMIFILLLGITLWRWFKRGQQAGHSKWKLFSLLIRALAFYGAVISIVTAVGVIVMLVEYSGKMPSFDASDIFFELAVLLGFFITLFVSTPLPPLPKLTKAGSGSWGKTEPVRFGSSHLTTNAMAEIQLGSMRENTNRANRGQAAPK